MRVKKINGKFNGAFSLEGIKFDKIRTAVVGPSNETSGKIYFSKSDIGKMVYILYPKGGD